MTTSVSRDVHGLGIAPPRRDAEARTIACKDYQPLTDASTPDRQRFLVPSSDSPWLCAVA